MAKKVTTSAVAPVQSPIVNLNSLSSESNKNIGRFAHEILTTEDNLKAFTACLEELASSPVGFQLVTAAAINNLAQAFDTAPYTTTGVTAYGVGLAALNKVRPVVVKHFGDNFSETLLDPVMEAVANKVCHRQLTTTKAYEEAAKKLADDKKTEAPKEQGTAVDMITKMHAMPLINGEPVTIETFTAAKAKAVMVCTCCTGTTQKKKFQHSQGKGGAKQNNVITVPEGLGDVMIRIGNRMFLADLVDGHIVCGSCRAAINKQLVEASKSRTEKAKPAVDNSAAEAAKAAELEAKAIAAKIETLTKALQKEEEAIAAKQTSLNNYTVSRDAAKLTVDSSTDEEEKAANQIALEQYQGLLDKTANSIKDMEKTRDDLAKEIADLKG